MLIYYLTNIYVFVRILILRIIKLDTVKSIGNTFFKVFVVNFVGKKSDRFNVRFIIYNAVLRISAKI